MVVILCSSQINFKQYSAVQFIYLSLQLLFSLINIYPLWKQGQVERQPLMVWLAFSVPAILYCFNNNVAILVQRYLDPASYVVGSLIYLIPRVLAAFLLATRRCVQSRTHLLTYV
jgi:probable UDP-sugar transporter A4